MSDAALAAVLKRDRAIDAACLVVLILLAWAYIVWLADDMEMGGMDMTGFRMIPAGKGLMMPVDAPWHTIEFAFVFVMWAVMMVGMMTPSVAPLILLYARVGGQAAALHQPFATSAFLAGGYLSAWIVFSFAATIAQWAVERQGWLTPAMSSESNTFGGLTLIAAGLFQWTPLKDACLRQCQFPLQFIQRHGGVRGRSTGPPQRRARPRPYCRRVRARVTAQSFWGGGV